MPPVPPVSDEARALHREAPVVDLHVDSFLLKRLVGYDLAKRHRNYFPRAPVGAHYDIPRMREGGVKGVGWGVVVSPWARDPARSARKMIDLILAEVRRLGGDLALARTAGEMRSQIAQGKISGILGVEGGHALGGSIESLRGFHEQGVRYLTLTHFTENELGYPSTFHRHAARGLKDFGREVVAEANRLGILLDVSHLSPAGVENALEASRAPLFASHIGCSGLFPHWRNLEDRHLRGIADRGGVVGIIFYPGFLGKSLWGDLDLVVAHLEHVIKVGGEETPALGSDMDGFIGSLPRGVRGADDLPRLTTRLLERHPARVVRKILGENFLRYFDSVSR